MLLTVGRLGKIAKFKPSFRGAKDKVKIHAPQFSAFRMRGQSKTAVSRLRTPSLRTALNRRQLHGFHQPFDVPPLISAFIIRGSVARQDNQMQSSVKVLDFCKEQETHFVLRTPQ